MYMRLACIALLLALASPGAHAFCATKGDPDWRPGMYTVSSEFARSKYVLRVRSVGETWLDDDGKPTQLKPPFRAGSTHPLGMDPYLGAIYELEVLEVFKGSPPKRLKLFSSNTTARTPLPVNGEYLLFIQQHRGRDEVGLTLFIDNCGNSREKSSWAPALSEVKALAARK